MLAMKDRSISALVKNDLCFQCGTCSSACKIGAIKMSFNDNRGLIYPEVDQATCTNCGICLKVCPINNLEEYKTDHLISKTEKVGIYVSSDKSIIKNTASGGMVSRLLRYLFEQKKINKAVVAGMDTINDPTLAKGYIITHESQIEEIAGSIYQPVSLNEVLKDINKEDKIAFVGLPCHIRGLTNLQKININLKNNIVIKIGLICTIGRGRNGTKFVLNKFNRKNEIVSRLRYRYGNHPGGLMIQTNKEKKNIKMPDYLQYIDFLYMPKGCLFCNDLFNDLGDISVGDPWGLIEEKKVMAIIRNKEAEEFVKEAVDKKYIDFEKYISNEEAVKTQWHGVVYKILNYKKRVSLYKDMGMSIPQNIEVVENQQIKLRTKIGYRLLVLNSVVFNSKIGYKLIKIIPSKILKRYRAIVATQNCKEW